MKFNMVMDTALKNKATFLTCVDECIKSRGDLINKHGDFFRNALDGEAKQVILDGKPDGQYSSIINQTTNKLPLHLYDCKQNTNLNIMLVFHDILK